MRRLIPLLFVITGLGLGSLLFYGGAAGQEDAAPAAALGSGFTYQGRLEIEGAPAGGIYDLQFRLFDAATGGTQVGSTVTRENVAVSEGLFSVLLDFGTAVFDGQALWLEVAVREGDSDGAYSSLSPLQALSAAPYALHALQAGSVAWSDVQSRPAGLDDGDDDTTYTAGTGLVLAGDQFSAQGSPYSNLLVVAKSGGDFSSVQAALDSIGDAAAANPYLVYVAPGVYEEQVALKPYVALEGAGEGTTTILWTGGSQAPWEGGGSATMRGADNATVRHLTVESDGTGQTFAVGFYNDGASPVMAHVSARAWNASDTRGVANYTGSAPTMTDVTATAFDGGNNHAVTNDTSAAVMIDVTATASGGNNNYGVINWNATTAPVLIDVTATGLDGQYNNYGIFNHNAAPLITGGIATASGGNTNRGVYSRSGSAPEMKGLAVSVSGGVNNDGVFSLNSSPQMQDLSVVASGASFTNRGVYNAGSPAQMSDVTITASGGTFSIGVYNNDSASTMNNVTATATDGADNYGLYNDSASPTIRHSVLEGSTNSAFHDGSGSPQVANSQLVGTVDSGLSCFNNYDANLSAVACP